LANLPLSVAAVQRLVNLQISGKIVRSATDHQRQHSAALHHSVKHQPTLLVKLQANRPQPTLLLRNLPHKHHNRSIHSDSRNNRDSHLSPNNHRPKLSSQVSANLLVALHNPLLVLVSRPLALASRPPVSVSHLEVLASLLADLVNHLGHNHQGDLVSLHQVLASQQQPNGQIPLAKLRNQRPPATVRLVRPATGPTVRNHSGTVSARSTRINLP
jgi:hypothetical protein